MPLEPTRGDGEHRSEWIQRRRVVVNLKHLHLRDGPAHMLQCAGDAADHILERNRVAAAGNAAGNPRLIEIGRFQMDQDHDDLITQAFGSGDKVDLGGMGIHRLKAEAGTLLKQPLALLGHRQPGRFIAVEIGARG